MEKVLYSSVVGSLMYAMVATRPDIAFAVGVVSHYMANPGKKHWDPVKYLLRYLKGTTSKCLCFGNSEASIMGYTDADYAGFSGTQKFTSGYVFPFARVAVSWRSLLQTCTSSSTTESEFVAASSASKEVVWLAHLVGDLRIHQILVLHYDDYRSLAHSIKLQAQTRFALLQPGAMAGVSSDLLWQLVKKNNKFLVKRNGNSSASVQFSSEPNNLYNLNSFKYSGLANKKTVSIVPGNDLSVYIATTKTKKSNKPKDSVNRSHLKRDVRRMSTVVVNQVVANGYRPDLKAAALAKLSTVHKSLRAAKFNLQFSFSSGREGDDVL
ncbi:hypothetical protein L7F22_031851 [Adiantum nelumboides]|nr:hypothetical protein [Adiantum nelumboides]